jgi:hypothetical protein
VAAQFARVRGARKWSVGVIAGALLAAVLAFAGSGGGAPGGGVATGRVSTASPARFRQAVIARMHAEHLDYQWVACVPTGGRFDGVRVVRCNVDFGVDPHVVAYCSVLRGGHLLTSQQDPNIPCGHDNAGYSATIVRYG